MVKVYAIGNRETGICFSPFVWRIILALKHKKIEHELEILSLVEVGPKISKITGKWKLVPLVQFDNGSYNYDSFDIAVGLEKRYPDSPKLFPNGLSNAKFHDSSFRTLCRPLFKRIFFNMLKCINEEDQKQFRKNCERMFKCTVEEFVGDSASLLNPFGSILDPLRAALKHAPYVEGNQPSLSDYIFCSALQWMKITSPGEFKKFITNDQDDTLNKWYDVIDKILGGYIKSFKTAREV